MLVDRHGTDIQILCQPAHGQLVDADVADQVERSIQIERPVMVFLRRGAGVGIGGDWTKVMGSSKVRANIDATKEHRRRSADQVRQRLSARW
ncbi:MAG: hypothetical protein R3F38_15060 [Gammaproteobacteria bacterium]